MFAGYFFFVIFSYYLIKPLREGIFLERYSSTDIPVVNILTLAGIWLFGMVYNHLHRRFSRLLFMLQVNALLFGFLVLFGLAFHFEDAFGRQPQMFSRIVALFYIWLNIFNLFSVSLFWSITNEVYPTSLARRDYGFIGAGGIAGGIVAGLVSWFLYTHLEVPPREMILVCIPFYLCCIVLPSVIIMAEQDRITTETGVPPGEKKGKSALGEVFDLLRRDRYLLLIAAVMFLKILSGTVFHYEFYSTLQRNVDKGFYTQLNNLVFLSVNVLALGINLFVTPYMLRRYSLQRSLSALPLLVVALSWFLLVDWFALIMVGGVVMSGLTYSFDRSGKEFFYIPTEVRGYYWGKS